MKKEHKGWTVWRGNFQSQCPDFYKTEAAARFHANPQNGDKVYPAILIIETRKRDIKDPKETT